MKRRAPEGGDRLVGIRPRERRDFYAGCNEPGTAAFMPDAAAFMRVWCQRCRRLECIRAKSVVHAWERRMEEQPEYLINAPNFSDLTDPRHQELAKIYFASLKSKAERLEIAAIRQDWEIPEGPTDGMAQIASNAATTSFDDAVRELARAQGTEPPLLPTELPEDAVPTAPSFFQEESDDIEYETPYPSSTKRGVSYRVALSKAGQWSCECDGFKNLAKCYHLTEVRTWYEKQLVDPDPPPDPEPPRPPAAPPVASAPNSDPRIPVSRPLNTPMPPSGVMIGGGAAPAVPPTRPPTPPPPVDPWAPRRDNVVEPGAKIVVQPPKKP